MTDAQAVFLALNTYYDRHFHCHAVKILPSEYYVCSGQSVPGDNGIGANKFAANNPGFNNPSFNNLGANKLIVTVLGSCVAVCLRDSLTGVSGMNHFLLPGDAAHTPCFLNESGRYGVHAMEMLINQMLKNGASRRHLQAKVFGGGNMLRGVSVNPVGQRNAEFVVDYLQREAIPLIAQDLLGDLARKVYFFTDTGQVLVKRLKNLHNTTIMDRESEYRMQVKLSTPNSTMEWFEPE